MSSNPRRHGWSVADRISVVVVLSAAMAILFGLRSGAIGSVGQEPRPPLTLACAAEGAGADCDAKHLGLLGDPATGMPYP